MAKRSTTKKKNRTTSPRKTTRTKNKNKNKKSTTSAKRSSRRELIVGAQGRSYARRDRGGRFDEMDGVKRASKQDPKRRAKTASTRGQGDRGDRRR